jgi:hypothetical protein
MYELGGREAMTHGLAGRATAVDPAGLGLDVVLLALAEVAEQPPCAAAALAHYTFLGTSHRESWRHHQLTTVRVHDSTNLCCKIVQQHH